MQIHLFLPFSCMLLLGAATEYSAGQTPLKDREAGTTVSPVHAILREASELALKQGDQERYWIDRVLLQIGEQQTRAGDFDGALRSLRGSRYDYGRHWGLFRLVEALARAGKKDRALKVSRLLEPGWGWTQQGLRDAVQFRWVEHLIAKGNLQQASKAIEQIKSPRVRHEALRTVAVAFGKSGDEAQAAKHFSQAIEAAAGIQTDFARAKALWETAEAQRLVRFADKAQATLRRLADNADNLKDPWARVSALRECAVLAAKLKDKETAQSLFDRAVKSHQTVDESNKIGALEQIAIAQASVGFIDGARKTAAMIEHDEHDFTKDGYREHALYAIAVAQINAGDVDAAIGTALSIKHFVQYRDDALNYVVAYHLGKRDLKSALATTQKFENPSRKATAILKVAAAQARAGDRKAAADIAAQIKLTHRSEVFKLLNVDDKGFDFRRPQTWSANYDAHDFFTMASRAASVRRTAEVAAAAMELAQALEYKPVQPYADLFNDINTEEVIQSLARAYALFGDSKEAVGWAKQIGSGDIIPEKDGDRVSWAVQRRLCALLGVAEGMLDRSK